MGARLASTGAALRCCTHAPRPIGSNRSGSTPRAVLFLSKRLFFQRPDGSRQPANSGAPAVLVVFEAEDLNRLRNSGLAGHLIIAWERVRLHDEITTDYTDMIRRHARGNRDPP